jgi:hypothetical protein
MILCRSPGALIADLDADLDAFEGDRRVYCRTWHETIPRDLL